MIPYVDEGLKIIRSFMNHPGQKRNVRYQSLNCLSAFILAGEELIHPYMRDLLENLFQIITQASDIES